jgi:hypothetical protein
MACIGVPVEDDASHYGSGTRDKVDYPAYRLVGFG